MPYKPSAAFRKGMSAIPTKTKARHKRRCGLLGLCLGLGALAAALLARLLAHRPQCPGVSRKRPSLSPLGRDLLDYKREGRSVQMQVNVPMRV